MDSLMEDDGDAGGVECERVEFRRLDAFKGNQRLTTKGGKREGIKPRTYRGRGLEFGPEIRESSPVAKPREAVQGSRPITG